MPHTAPRCLLRCVMDRTTWNCWFEVRLSKPLTENQSSPRMFNECRLYLVDGFNPYSSQNGNLPQVIVGLKIKKYLKPPPSYKGAVSKGKDRLPKNYFFRGHSLVSEGVFFLGARLLSVFGWELFFKRCLIFWKGGIHVSTNICICI